jgi:nitroreductase
MELNKVLKERRSIRKYKDQKVEHELIEQCLNAAILAPSWKNSQTARYYVIESDEMLKAFKAEALPEFNANNCANAPVLIVTAFQKNHSGFDKDGTPTNECGQGWGYYDLGLHNMNLLLKATELGLGTLVMGIRNESKIRELLDIANDEIIVSVIALGYKDIDPQMPIRKEVNTITKFY